MRAVAKGRFVAALLRTLRHQTLTPALSRSTAEHRERENTARTEPRPPRQRRGGRRLGRGLALPSTGGGKDRQECLSYRLALRVGGFEGEVVLFGVVALMGDEL